MCLPLHEYLFRVQRRPSDSALPEGFFDDPVKDAKVSVHGCRAGAGGGGGGGGGDLLCLCGVCMCHVQFSLPVLCAVWQVCVLLVQARKVQYKDAMEEEWERFQKSIQQEEKVSRQPQCHCSPLAAWPLHWLHGAELVHLLLLSLEGRVMVVVVLGLEKEVGLHTLAVCGSVHELLNCSVLVWLLGIPGDAGGG